MSPAEPTNNKIRWNMDKQYEEVSYRVPAVSYKHDNFKKTIQMSLVWLKITKSDGTRINNIKK